MTWWCVHPEEDFKAVHKLAVVGKAAWCRECGAIQDEEGWHYPSASAQQVMFDEWTRRVARFVEGIDEYVAQDIVERFVGKERKR